MNNNFTKAETIDFNKARLVSASKTIHKRFETNQDLFSRLTRKLQTTLEINALIRLFLAELHDYVLFDHFEYFQQGQGIHFGSAPKGSHHCDYRLTLSGEDLGTLKLSRQKKFRDEELTLIENLLAVLVYPLRNALLYQQAMNYALTDPLTGIGNKRALEEQMHREAEIARRHGHALSMIIADIDHFKQINDEFGHTVGDEVLKQVGKTIESVCRKSDQVFRFGGEEFVILLRDTSLTGARAMAERIRKKVADNRYYHGEHHIPVTISLGVAQFDGNQDIRQLFDQADDALYQAKNSGRNCTYCFGSTPAIKEEQSSVHG